MALKDYIKDLTTYVTTTGFFDKIRITASDKEISIDAVDKEREIILKGKFNKPLADLTGTFGLSNLSLLQTITSDPEFAAKETTMSVVYEVKDGENTPTSLTYENKSKSYIKYRFMNKNLLPDPAKLLVTKWDLVINPSKSNIQQFVWAANGLAMYEQYFSPKVVDGELKFFIGEDSAATQKGGVVFATDVKENFDSGNKWKIQHLLTGLKSSDSCDCEMSFSAKGAIEISLKTGLGNYRYIFPAISR